MIAAAYARFSSDAQREESIEIQMGHIRALCEREGWELGTEYADHAVSGRTGERPGFRRMLADAEAGLFDVLVIYKQDRLARNVRVAQEAKRRLFAAGVRLVSVREGEVRDTPDGFLMGVMGDAFAEYYSRNLSVLVRDGIRKSAEGCRACGRRMFGYRVGEGDLFEEDPATGWVVRELYQRYAAGQTMTELCEWLNREGVRTLRGGTWQTQNLARVMSNEAYKGTYRYGGVEVEGGMPALVDAATWETVQRMRASRHNRKRRKVVNDYLLTDRAWCLSCGMPMCGTAGTSATGRKYTYYGCVHRGGCGLRVPSGAAEDAVMAALRDVLSDEDTVEGIVRDVVAHFAAMESHADEWRAEADALRREVDRLVGSIAKGVPAESVAGAIAERQARVADLERRATVEENAALLLPDEGAVRDWLEPYLDGDADDPEWRSLVARTFVHKVFLDREHVVIALSMGGEGEQEVSWEQVRELKRVRTSGYSLVRTGRVWWATVSLTRTPTVVLVAEV